MNAVNPLGTLQYNQSGSEEVDVVQLLLKRQSELNALLELTMAINRSSSSAVLFEMLEMILKVNLKISKMRLMLKNGDVFFCANRFGGNFESPKTLQSVCKLLESLKTTTHLSSHANETLKEYDYFIPVRQKNDSLAFVLIGGMETRPELITNDLNFIQTLINIIVVALENKKLYRESIIRERLQRDIELASEIQTMLVPMELPKSNFYEVKATYLPHENIGGDYFDFILLNEDELLWCIADVSGKGIAAALLMANLQASLRAWATVEKSIESLIYKLNEVVAHNTKGDRFVTLFLARFNKKTRQLEYINAGHNAPIVITDDKVSFLKEGTTILGAFEQLPFIKTGRITLPVNSLIFNYTDGLIENPDENVFISEDELIHYLQLNKNISVQHINDNMMNYIRTIKNVKTASDDITLLTIRLF